MLGWLVTPVEDLPARLPFDVWLAACHYPWKKPMPVLKTQPEQVQVDGHSLRCLMCSHESFPSAEDALRHGVAERVEPDLVGLARFLPDL